MAPRRPANHKTACVLAVILFDFSRQRLATKLSGKMLMARPIKQLTNATIEKVKSQFWNPPVNTPIPMYRNTIVSVRLFFYVGVVHKKNVLERCESIVPTKNQEHKRVAVIHRGLTWRRWRKSARWRHERQYLDCRRCNDLKRHLGKIEP